MLSYSRSLEGEECRNVIACISMANCSVRRPLVVVGILPPPFTCNNEVGWRICIDLPLPSVVMDRLGFDRRCLIFVPTWLRAESTDLKLPSDSFPSRLRTPSRFIINAPPPSHLTISVSRNGETSRKKVQRRRVEGRIGFTSARALAEVHSKRCAGASDIRRPMP